MTPQPIDHPDRTEGSGPDYDAIVVGAGFSGMYMLHELRNRGFRVHVFEAGHGVGGTWHWNRYPGARCDVPSLDYSYSFSEELQQDWRWTERYASQPEILRYANHVCERFDLARDITFGVRVSAADFDEPRNLWRITTDDGHQVSSRFLISAVGCLSQIQSPQWPGLPTYRGETHHTGQWPHEEIGFSGRRVGVIGTGSSGIQLIPVLAAQADRFVVFQRTPNFSVPARNRPLSDDEQRDVKDRYPQIRRLQRQSATGALHPSTGKSVLAATDEERTRELETRWEFGGTGFMAAFTDVLRNADSNELVAEFVRSKIQKIVRDPTVAEKLTPRDHPIGAKRICLDSGYFETYNRDNVELVDVRAEPIAEFTAHGLRTTQREYQLDAVIFATGYDGMTGALTRMNIRGRGGVSLSDTWRSQGPRTYLGLAVHGFPNLFTITGPGSPSVLVNMIMAGEQHATWIADLLEHLRSGDARRIEAQPGAQDDWSNHVNEAAHRTLYPRANSWYVGANIPGKPRMFMPYAGGFDVYRRTCDEIAADNYAGFSLSR